MELFPQGFSQADASQVDPTHETPQSSVPPPEEGGHETQHSAAASNMSAHGEHDEHDADLDTPARGKSATDGLSVDEKKERQKQQNRLAAERSRAKKREEL